MTNARFLRSSTLEILRGSIKKNLLTYRTGNFDFLLSDDALFFTHSVEIDQEAILSLLVPRPGQLYEAENCEILGRAMGNLMPYEARDERLWVYMTHTNLLNYTRARWPIPDSDEEAVKHINKHFFARDKRQVERDNSASRLWWMAHLCSRISTIDQKVALEAFLFRTDVRANIIERPTTSQANDLFGAILQKLVDSFRGNKTLFERSTFRRLMTEINSVGGYKLLEYLSPMQADKLVSDIISNKLGLETI